MNSSICFLMMHIGVEALALARNVILARLLGPTEMGYATLLAVTLRMLEMASDVATDRMLIQSKLGKWSALQRAAHGVEILRGILMGLLIVVAGFAFGATTAGYPPIGAFCCLATIPVLRGFQHLDFKRLQRNFDYRRAAFVELLPAIVSIAMLGLLSSFWNDYRLVIAVVMVQAIAFLIASHWMAVRTYKVSFSGRLIRKFLAFGLPLALNGLLMFLVFQGDRLLVSFTGTPAELAKYAIAFQISLIPVLILSRVCNSLFLPLFARLKSDKTLHDFNVQFCSQAVGLIAIVFFALSILYQGTAIQVLYGSDYTVASRLILCLALMHSIRLVRCVPSVVAIASGDSMQPLWVNFVRALGVLAAGICALNGCGMIEIAACGCLGELLALAAAIYGMRFRLAVAGGALLQSTILGLLAGFVLFYQQAGVNTEVAALLHIASAFSLALLVTLSLVSCMNAWPKVRETVCQAYVNSRSPSQALS